MAHADAQKIVNVIREAVKQMTRKGAQVDMRRGIVHTGGAYLVSAYFDGENEYAVEGIRVPAGAYYAAGDYVVAHFDGEGDAWVNEGLPRDTYPTLAIDANGGRVLLGDGTTEPTAAPYGWLTYSGGDASAYFAPPPEGGSGSGVTDGDKGDVVVSGSGTVWTVEDDSHAHTSSTVTPAGIGAATSGHNHDGTYSASAHNHDGTYEASGAVATHAGLSDPHTGYQKESEKGVANGYPELDSGGEIPWAQVPLEMVKVAENETNTTTSATNSSIQFDIASNEILNIIIWGWYNRGSGTNAASSVQIKMTGPSGAAQRGQVSWTTTNTDWNVEEANSYDTNFPSGGMIASSGNAARFFRVDVRIANGSTAGTIIMQFKRTGGTAGDQVAIVQGTSAIAY